jgi:LacI family transcriptional regulator
VSRSPATLTDVARLAGVSLATASRALNGADSVVARTSERVRLAAEQLRYLPRASARALRSRRSGTLGAVFPTLDNSFYTPAVNSLQSALDDAGYALLVSGLDYSPERESRAVDVMIERGVEALVLVGLQRTAEIYSRLEHFGIPYVVLWLHDASRGHPSIGIDNRGAMLPLTRHLLDAGHEHFALISPDPSGNDRVRERVIGIEQGLAARGHSIPASHRVTCRSTIGEGRRALARLIEAEPVTAVMCNNDLLAAGAILELRARGLRVPGDVSVTGFGDYEIAGAFEPAITTVRAPFEDIGRRAASYLIGRLEGRKVSYPDALPAPLVVRESSGCAPAAQAHSRASRRERRR